MHYELIAGESAADGMRRILLEGVDYIIAQLTEPQPDRDVAIHNARKTFKRLRAALRLVRPTLGADAWRTENVALRDASRLLAPLRDSAVLIEVLDHIATWAAGRPDVPTLPAAPLADVRAALVTRHAAIGAQLLGSDDTTGRVAEQVHAVGGRLAAYPLPTAGFDALAGVRAIYQRGHAAMTVAALSAQDAHLYHEWRKQVKYLWHAFEIMLPVWPQLFGYLAEELHVLSGHLGDAHDAAVLRDLLQQEPALHGDSALRDALPQALTVYETWRYAQARPLGLRMYVDTPDAFVARLRTAWDVWQTTDSATLLASQHDWLGSQLVGTAEAAVLLGQPVPALRRLLRDGRLPAVKLGGTWLIPRAAVAQLQPK